LVIREDSGFPYFQISGGGIEALGSAKFWLRYFPVASHELLLSEWRKTGNSEGTGWVIEV
jgi:hypothetical protein